MKTGNFVFAPAVLLVVLSFFLTAGVVKAQESPAETETPSETETEVAEEEILHYSDFMVKAYTLTPYYGDFSGATYLDVMEYEERTVITPGPDYINGYDGNILPESKDPDHYDAPRKEIESGPMYGLRIGLYANRDFHLDLSGGYATGKAVTTMRYKPEGAPESQYERQVVDQDDGYSLVKAGVHLGYDARPAAFWGITPKLGFGLGGLINRYSYLEDKTALYLEGNFGLTAKLFGDFSLTGQVDLTSFAYEVDELGYSNFVNYTTFSLGVTWYIDVIPADVRAAHQAELDAMDE